MKISISTGFDFELVCPGTWKKGERIGCNTCLTMKAPFNDETQKKFARMAIAIRHSGCKVVKQEGLYLTFRTADHSDWTLFYDGCIDSLVAVEK